MITFFFSRAALAAATGYRHDNKTATNVAIRERHVRSLALGRVVSAPFDNRKGIRLSVRPSDKRNGGTGDRNNESETKQGKGETFCTFFSPLAVEGKRTKKYNNKFVHLAEACGPRSHKYIAIFRR